MVARTVYRGVLGSTRKTLIHYTCPCGTIISVEVYRSVDVSAQPELRQRLLTAAPGQALNSVTCPRTQAPVIAAVPVVYHDPDDELFVLVLPESDRHRELAARAELFRELDSDPAPIPGYVRDFAVVFGPAGLSALIHERAERAHLAAKEAKNPRARDPLATERAEPDTRAGSLEQMAQELARREAELMRTRRELDELAGKLRAAEGELATRRVEAQAARTRDDTVIVAVAPEHGDPENAHTNPFTLFDGAELDGKSPRGDTAGDVVTAETQAASDPAVESLEAQERARWIDSGEPFCAFAVPGGDPLFCVTARPDQADMLLAASLDVRLQLHRFPVYPLLVLTLGMHESPGERPTAAVAIPLDPGVERDRQVLFALAQRFAFVLEVYDTAYALRRTRRVAAPLEANTRGLLGFAGEHLDTIAVSRRSFAKAVSMWANPEFDRYGWSHPERPEFRQDKLTDLTTAQSVRRALAIADRFSNPKREEYLLLTRGYPLRLWHSQRRAVLARAVDLGIWMGSRLAPIAVREGLAHSHEDLVTRLRENFALLQARQPGQAGAEVNDLDPDAASDNWAALEAELASGSSDETDQAKPRRRRAQSVPISSGLTSSVSGTIAETTRVVRSARAPHNLSSDELLVQLGHAGDCVDAAVELARRGELRALAPIMAVLERLNRTDAVRVVGVLPSFGDAATESLVHGLHQSRKSFVRQGCALALAVLKNETALEALSDQLIVEPTAIWKEIARGLGLAGPGAVMPLASRLAGADDRTRERVAWALAHIAATTGKKQIRQLAAGRDLVAAAIAKHALELTDFVKSDDLRVRGAHTPKEQTVNRAFSRRFFQALEASSPVVDALAAAGAREISNPGMILDESDLLEATEYDDDTGELLDDGDLIPT